MRVVLVQPKSITPHFEPPLGLAYLRAVLQEAGYDATIIDLNIEQHALDWSALSPDLACISALDSNAAAACGVIRKLRDELPGVRIAIGGPHFSYHGDRLVETGLVEFLVRGEGEGVIADIAALVERGTSVNVPGVTTKQGRSAQILKAPDDLWKPTNPLAYLDLAKYRMESDEVGVVFSRGCPHSCAFCQVGSLSGHRVRSCGTTASQIVASVAKVGFRTLSVWDDSLWSALGDPDVECVLTALAALRGTIPWRCNIRVDQLTAPVVRRLAAAGCATLRIGIETLNARAQRTAGKVFTRRGLMDGLRLVKENGLSAWCSLIVGLPGDTVQDIVDNIVVMERLVDAGLIDDAQFRPLVPLAGTTYHENATGYGFWPMRHRVMGRAGYGVPTTGLDATEIAALVEDADRRLLPRSRIPNRRT